MSEEMVKNLGPLGKLIGVWEGDKGDDVAPSDDRGTEKNKYRERMTFEAFGPQTNHEQNIYGLRYFTKAWRIGEPDPFHEDIGYWLWDAKLQQVMKVFVIPRGIALIAGGKATPAAKSFEVKAKEKSPTYGVLVNPFLQKEFKIVEFKLSMTMHDNKSFTYEQNTRLKIKGQKKVFSHTDKNTLHLITTS